MRSVIKNMAQLPYCRINYIFGILLCSALLGCTPAPAPKAPGTEPTPFAAAAPNTTTKQVQLAGTSKVRDFSTELPWPSIAVKIPEVELHQLQKWLLTTPPPSTIGMGTPNTKENAHYINQWNAYEPLARQASNKRPLSMNAVLVLSTFWLYGLNINESLCAKQMSLLVINAKTDDPSHPLPFALEALFFLHIPEYGDAEKAFTEALSRHPSDKLKQLLQLGYGVLCYREGNIHQSILQYNNALEVGRANAQYHPLLSQGRKAFAPPLQNKYSAGELFAQQGSKFQSIPLGFQFQTPKGWRITQTTGFHAKKRAALVQLTLTRPQKKPAPEQSSSPLTIVIEPHFSLRTPSRHLTPQKKKAEVIPLPQPIAHPHFKKWIHFPSPNAAGSQKDHPITIAAAAEVMPSAWSKNDHLLAAKEEGSCSNNTAHKQLAYSKDTQSTVHQPQHGRLNHPLRIIVLMGATQKNLDTSLGQLAQFIETFYINDKSGTELLEKY